MKKQSNFDYCMERFGKFHEMIRDILAITSGLQDSIKGIHTELASLWRQKENMAHSMEMEARIGALENSRTELRKSTAERMVEIETEVVKVQDRLAVVERTHPSAGEHEGRIKELEERAHHADHRLIARIEKMEKQVDKVEECVLALDARLDPLEKMAETAHVVAQSMYAPQPPPAKPLDVLKGTVNVDVKHNGDAPAQPAHPPYKWRPKSEAPSKTGNIIVLTDDYAPQRDVFYVSTVRPTGNVFWHWWEPNGNFTHWCYLDEVPAKGVMPE